MPAGELEALLQRCQRRQPAQHQQVLGEVRRVALPGDRPRHAQQPRLAEGLIDGPAGMERRDGDGAVLLAEQARAAQPTAEEAGQLVPRGRQVLGVQPAQRRRLGQAVHLLVEVVDQTAQTVDAAGGLVRGIADAVGRMAHGGLRAKRGL